MTEIEKLVEISRFYGKKQGYAIAGGGNTSFKNDNFLWIKASGTSLSTITEEGFVKMDRQCLRKISGKNYNQDPIRREAEIKEELYACISGESKNRPSVETSLHNLLNFSFVVHTHPTLTNALMCSKNSRMETQKLFGKEALYVEYTDPGFVLFKLVEKRIGEYKKKYATEPEIIFLENHGVFVSANDINEIKNIYDTIEKKLRFRLNMQIPSEKVRENELDTLASDLSIKNGLKVRAMNSDLIQKFVRNKNSFEKADTAFTPDNIVYCKAHYLFSVNDLVTLMKDIENFKKIHGYSPKIIGIKEKGILCVDEKEKNLDTICEVYLDMLKISILSENFGGPRFMTSEQIEFIDTWEVENYRRKIAGI